MRVVLGAGWRLDHLTDREIILTKDDVTYRRFLDGCDGYVQLYAEPGMDRNALIDKAVQMAKRNDELLAERLAMQLVPRRLGGYQMLQRRLSPAFGTPEGPKVIGVKRA